MSSGSANAEIQKVARALEAASTDLFSFAVICTGGMQALADSILQEIFLLALERGWFTEDFDGNLSHDEFRIDLFREVWRAVKDNPVTPTIGIDVPIGHEQMEFYRLPLRSRASLYLRTKRKLSYANIAEILDAVPEEVRVEVERVRSILLGRAPKEFIEEAF